MLFLLDGMLGSLARWLRIAGYDTIYYRDRDDEDLIKEALTSNRILLSRDRELVNRASKRNVTAILVNHENVQTQLVQIKNELKLALRPSVSRCPVCNGELSKRTRDEVSNLVPESSLDAFDEFWTCDECGKAYWKGTHWEKITETLGKF
jgi:uncharacterized protein with PIN domain